MELITEDTPEGGPDELRWRIDQLKQTLKRKEEEVGVLQERFNIVRRREMEANARFVLLTNLMTVKALRDAGIRVTVDLPEPECEDDYDED